MQRQIITEQCGARWIIERTEVNGDYTEFDERAYWVQLMSGKSAAKPGYIGFYAASIDAACDALNN